MLKRALMIVLTLALVCSLMIPVVFADLIWEPYDNSFYTKHSDECTFHNRMYLANAEEGGVRVYDAPNGNKEVGTVQNGVRMNIYYIWNGDWGYTPGWGEDLPEGWVKMDGMSLIYDDKSFEEEYGALFYQDEAEVQAFRDALTEEDILQVYSYPGSGEVESTIPVNWLDNPETIGFTRLYKDEAGLVWGYLGYLMGPRTWVCLSDPTNAELPMVIDHTVELNPARPLEPNSGLATPTIAGVLVAGVAALSVILLKRKRK